MCKYVCEEVNRNLVAVKENVSFTGENIGGP